MRITQKDMTEYGDLLTKRFPTLSLNPRGSGWAIRRDRRLQVDCGLDTNRETVAWMDGFHKGADEREAEIRTAIGKAFASRYEDGWDDDKLLAVLTTWLPAQGA